MSSLLPGNSTPLETSFASAIARLSEIPVPIATIKTARETDPRNLTALGWEFSVNEWQPTWGIERKRDVVDVSPEVHRHLGTAGSEKRAIGALGYQVTVEEWFQYGGDPYKFRISIDLDVQSLNTADYLMLTRAALDAKNVRSHFEGFSARSLKSGRIGYGFGHASEIEAVYQPLVPPVYETRVRIGTGIGIAPVVITAIYQPLQ